MKRAGILGLAIVLTLGLAVSASHAAKAKKVKTEAEIEGLRTFPGNQSEIFGDVHSKKSKCEKGRRVTLRGPVDSFGGTVTTDSTGDWVYDIGPSAPPVGNYFVEVARKRVGSGDNKLVCKATTSPETFIEI
jgi:hypothetical protein